MTTNWRKEAFEEFAERRKVKEGEILDARARLEHSQTVLRAREAELAELDRAAKVLGIVSEHAQAEILGPSRIIRRVIEHSVAEVAEATGFKALAIEYLKNNYPNPVRAADLQSFVERKLMRKFHEKTAGMTLFRLSKDQIARRSGWDWYYVPEDERVVENAEHSREDTMTFE